MIINITDTIIYNSDLSFDKQSDEFKEYFFEKYNKVPKIPYPAFDEEGNISYSFTDDTLNYSVKRVQEVPFSTSDRRVNKLIVNIEII